MIQIGNATLYHGDCKDILPTLPQYDAVVTDPPYGINAARRQINSKHRWNDYSLGNGEWDKERPSAELLKLVVASGEIAIVWGGNYFTDCFPPSEKWLIWDKGQTDFSLADCEVAWCSFPGAIRRITIARPHALQDIKEHPTQKSLIVMEWCLTHLPKKCETIIDPFMGSGTTGVAVVKSGAKFVGIEREKGYFDIACRRIEEAQKQPGFF